MTEISAAVAVDWPVQVPGICSGFSRTGPGAIQLGHMRVLFCLELTHRASIIINFLLCGGRSIGSRGGHRCDGFFSFLLSLNGLRELVREIATTWMRAREGSWKKGAQEMLTCIIRTLLFVDVEEEHNCGGGPRSIDQESIQCRWRMSAAPVAYEPNKSRRSCGPCTTLAPHRHRGRSRCFRWREGGGDDRRRARVSLRAVCAHPRISACSHLD